MPYRINEYQRRLYYKLFATLPSVRKSNKFGNDPNYDLNLKSFNYFRSKDYWFTKTEKVDKYLFLFGIRDKPLNDICEKDICLIIDFDKNIQFNDNCLGVFSIKNADIHVLINIKHLKERYPNIDISNFKRSNLNSFEDSIDLEVIDLGSLNTNFDENLEKLIKAAYAIKSKKEISSHKIKNAADDCEICLKKKSTFKIDSSLNNLKNLKPELCGKCIEKIFVSEFYTKLTHLIKGNRTEVILDMAKEKFGNDQLFDIGLKLLKKYDIIRYIGDRNLFFTIDNDSSLLKKYIKYSDKDNLLIDNFKIVDSKLDRKPFEEKLTRTSVLDDFKEKDDEKQEIDKKPQISKLVKTDSFGNQITINQMNIIIEDLANGKNEDEAILHANVSKNTYKYWLNRGNQKFGELYVQFSNYVNELKSTQGSEKSAENNDLVDEGIYEPILKEYESSLDLKNKTGIAWVNKNGIKWYYSRSINGKTIRLSAHALPELYRKVIGQGLIWGITDYDMAREFIDFPDDFEIPTMEIEEELDKIDSGIYAPLAEEYESSFSSMNKSGIAWVNKTGSMWTYSRNVDGKTIRFSEHTLQNLYEKVIDQGLIWGIRDYDRAKEFIDMPDNSETYLMPKVKKLDNDITVEVDPGIYVPLPEKYEKSFSSMNKSGIAWVNPIGNKFYYAKSIDGKNIRLSGENIYELYNEVKKANQIWGIRDYDRAKEFIDFPDDFEIPLKPQIEELVDDNIEELDPDIYAPLPLEFDQQFNSNPNKTGIAWVNFVGKKWVYQRNINKNKIYITDKNLYNLHQKVKEKNLTWGIKDYDKAKKFIKIPDNYIVPELPEESVEVNQDIYAPLPEKYFRSFNPKQKNRTGIAWVNKIGKRWVYQRKVNGVPIKFHDEEIRNLHKIVINNNQIWGIIDFDKAMHIIESNMLESEVIKPQIFTKQDNESNVDVNYLEKSINKVDIIINGIIKSKDLIDVFDRFELFKEDIKRIVVTSLNNEVDIFIELEIKKYLINKFEEEIGTLGWNIIK